jgi:lysophospholipase L1-like esterase
LEFRILKDNYGVPYLSDHYPVIAVCTPMTISRDVYNTVVRHNNTVSTRFNRQKDWARFGFYEKENESIHAANGKTTVVFYGNSITRNWYEMRPQFFDQNGFTGRGIGGQTSAELLVRMRQDVIDLHPKTVIIMCGTNDIAQNNGTISLEHTMGNIVSMCELAKANKIRPILCSALPARSFYWNPTVPDAPEQISRLNAMIKAYAEKSKITYVDYYSVMVAEDGGLKAGLSNDEVHPLDAGYEIMEAIILKVLGKH